MKNNFIIPQKNYKMSIRKVNLNNLLIGGENASLFMHEESCAEDLRPFVAVEILSNIPDNYSETLKKAWGDCISDITEWSKAAIEKGVDIIVLRFNIEDSEDINLAISQSCKKLQRLMENINFPLIIIGSERKEINLKLLPALAETATRPCTIGTITEDNYKEIIPHIKNYGHNIIAKTPIDINLAKQLNILVTEQGFDSDKIIIDPDAGALGYGLDYAYSIIERIKQAAFEGDTMLNMPVISFAGKESWKTKETKAIANIPDEWGDIGNRAIIWECLTASSLIIAGANIVVLYHPESIKNIRSFSCKVAKQSPQEFLD